ncbi:MAG: hypothetical protein Q8S09_14860 [Hyphomonas sp.]|nr:hypothetical protein [Hyphomonas sp.]
MSWLASFRALALSSVLAAAPVLPSVPEPPRQVTADTAADALFAGLEARPAISTSNLDVESLNAALAGAARLSYDLATQDTPTAPTRLTGFRFELLGDTPSTLFTAEEVLVWSANTDALIARMNGQQLGDTVRLFERIELSGVSMDLTDYSNAVDDAVTAALPAGEAAASLSYEDASMDVGRVILGGLTLHPWTFEETEGEEEGMAALRLLAAFARGFSLDSMVFLDADISQTMTDAGASGTVVSRYDRQLIEGYDRGNLAAMIQTGVTFSGSIPVPALDAELDAAATAPVQSVEMAGRSGYASWTGLSFAPLLEYAERGELPPITARDLWSFGTYTLADTEMSLDGKPVFEIGRLDMSADQFAWFLPERISLTHEDASLNLVEILKWAETLAPATPPQADGEPTVAEIIGILERTGLGKLSGDGTFSLTWNSDTGNALLERQSTTDGLYSEEIRLALRLPAYADLVPVFGVDGKTPDRTAFSALLDEKSAFIGGHYTVSDAGMLNALAALTIEVAKFSGEDDAMLSNFADSTPEAVRMFASGMLMFGSGAVAQEIPQATQWIASLSQFISSGGTFSVALAPEAELTAADFTGVGPDTGMAEAPGPAELIALLGLTVTHTPSGDTAAGAP